MELIENWWAELLIWAWDFNQPGNWWQLGFILLSLGLAWLIARGVRRLVDANLAGEVGALKKFTLRSVERIVYPLAALLIIILVRSIFRFLEQPTQLLVLASLLLLSLAGIRLLVYMLRKGFAPTPMLKAWENILATTIWLIVALYLIGILPFVLQTLDSFAFTLAGNRISVLSVINFLLLVALLFTLAVWVSAIIERRMQRATYLASGLQVALGKIVKVILIALAVLIALDTVGLDLTALTVFGGALGVGLGFGLQRIASNFISGFLLLFDRSIKPGDVISIGSKFGWVHELHARYIVVRDRDGVDTLIPNENLITTEVINWSYEDRNVRLKIPVQISYHDDPELAMQLMVDLAKQHPRVLPSPEPVGRLLEFGDNGIGVELRIWINDPEKGVNNVRSELNLAIWRAFKENNVTIPFPQRDVYIKSTPESGR